jgi:hypothetical protein
MTDTERLAEAIALLERCLDEIDCGIYNHLEAQELVEDARIFLASRAPAQPAAHVPDECHPAYCAHLQPAAPEPDWEAMVAREKNTAPEPSADKDWKAEYECCWRDCESWHARAEAAEAQLAAVREILDKHWRTPFDPDEVITSAAKSLVEIDNLLTPAPSPGAGEET